MIIAVSTPSGNTREGFLFFYPIYEPTWLQNLHTLGGYFWVYYWSKTAQSLFDTDFGGSFLFKFMTEVSMYGYLSHYLWIMLINHFLVRPYKMPFFFAGPLVIFLTFLVITVSFIALQKVSKMICPAKKRRDAIKD
jgi:hypothetical protein